jgi:hypothetical protein
MTRYWQERHWIRQLESMWPCVLRGDASIDDFEALVHSAHEDLEMTRATFDMYTARIAKTRSGFGP